jgi:hypothetical protein
MNDLTLRDHIRKLLDWSDAHVTFDAAVAGVPATHQGEPVPGFPHTLWELLEHIRIAQADILDFCTNPDYAELEWPRQYWPPTPAPPDPADWDASVQRVLEDRATLQVLALDTSIDLGDAIPHGSGQTYLRELLLVADHAAYHVGQMVMLRRALGIWGAD